MKIPCATLVITWLTLGAAHAAEPQSTRTGVVPIDIFIDDIIAKRTDKAVSQVGLIAGRGESLSGQQPIIESPRELVLKLETCHVKLAGEIVPGLKTMMRILWDCPDGLFISALDTKMRAPKLTVAEFRAVSAPPPPPSVNVYTPPSSLSSSANQLNSTISAIDIGKSQQLTNALLSYDRDKIALLLPRQVKVEFTEITGTLGDHVVMVSQPAAYSIDELIERYNIVQREFGILYKQKCSSINESLGTAQCVTIKPGGVLQLVFYYHAGNITGLSIFYTAKSFR